MINEAIKVLLIDDDEDDYVTTRDLFAKIEGQRFDLEWESNYVRAVETLKACRHDIYLIDYRLGENSGVDLVRVAVEYGCKSPVIILTGQGEREIDIEATRAGAADYLVKGSITPVMLERSIRHALDRKRSAEELQLSEERYRNLCENSNDLIQMASPDGLLVYVNSVWNWVMGYQDDEVMQTSFFDIVHPDCREKCVEVFSRAVAGGKIDYFETTFVTRDGRAIIVEGNITCTFKKGRATSVQGIFRDITGRKQMEQTLRQSEENYRLLIASIPDVTWMADLSGIPYFVSPNSEKLLGYSSEELCDRQTDIWSSRINPDDAALVRQLYEALFDGGSYDTEYRFQRKDKVWIWLHSRAVATYDKEGRLYAYGVTSDVNERKQLEMQLLQSQKMEAIGRLAGGVAHDFNNILTVILGYSDMMLGAMGSDSPSYKHAEQIRLAGVRGASLTHQLLAFSRQQILQPKILNVNQIVHGTQSMLKRLIGEDIALETRADMELGRIKGDEGQFEQIILNLAVNARDSMPHGGRLSIETSNTTMDETDKKEHPDATPGPYVKILVRDTGFGMDKETVDHVFEPFFTTKGQGKGTGLGLSTVYGIVKQSGGYIRVESEPGKGTAFEIFLPKVNEEAEPAEQITGVAKAPHGKETILLVEDDDMVRALTQHSLQLNGYTVLSANRGGEALLCCLDHNGPVDLMLTDVVMPEMSGPELARRLCAERPEMKVLFMSGYTDDTTIHHGLLNKNIEFLAKPFTPDDLARKVREVLDTGLSKHGPN